MQFLESSVWSPQSVENSIQACCSPLLEFAAIIKQHMYKLEPAQPGSRQVCSPPADIAPWLCLVVLTVFMSALGPSH